MHRGSILCENEGMQYYNFRTGEYDTLSKTPEYWSDYIPQSIAAQNLYKLLINDMDKTPLQAARYVLECATGVQHADEL